VCQLANWLMVRTRTMGYEMTLPVDRRDYVRQLGVAFALGHFQLWGVLCATTVVWWLVVATPPPFGDVAFLAMAALLMQICQFGVMVFVHAITTLRIVHVVAFVLPMFGAIILLVGDRQSNFQPSPEVLPIAAGSAALGLLLAYVAYRRWLRADFD